MSKVLRLSFDAYPVERGYSHVAEEYIASALKEHSEDPEELLAFLKSQVLGQIGENLLIVLSRFLDLGTPEWRSALISQALKVDHLPMRDAAVCAAEVWKGKNLKAILQNHQEPDDFLRTHIQHLLSEEEW